MRALALLVPCLLAAVPAAAQVPPSAEERQRMAREMMAAAQPGPEHAELMALAGSWDVEGRIWSTPGAEPMALAFPAENRAILGGRFLESRASGEMMGMPIESLAIYGFDRRHRKYTVVGYDTFGTYYVTGAGTMDPATRTVAMDGTDDDPITGMTQVYTLHLRFVDPDTYVTDVVFHDAAHTGGGPSVKVVELTHRRRK
ncbi:MAG TPA: DUF1579 family protein [Methylomirabilota bacterium]|nr:DUF1579 family protein [Methylomirabilota bacterium]